MTLIEHNAKTGVSLLWTGCGWILRVGAHTESIGNVDDVSAIRRFDAEVERQQKLRREAA